MAVFLCSLSLLNHSLALQNSHLQNQGVIFYLVIISFCRHPCNFLQNENWSSNVLIRASFFNMVRVINYFTSFSSKSVFSSSIIRHYFSDLTELKSIFSNFSMFYTIRFCSFVLQLFTYRSQSILITGTISCNRTAFEVFELKRIIVKLRYVLSQLTHSNPLPF